jgi:hypothetical protein
MIELQDLTIGQVSGIIAAAVFIGKDGVRTVFLCMMLTSESQFSFWFL